MRIKPLLHLVLFASLLLSGCAFSDREVIRIGLVAEISGGLPAIGASCQNAAELAVKEINSQGGLEVGGKKYNIELLIGDNAADVEGTKLITRQLIHDGNVIAIVGPNASRFAIPAAEIAEAEQAVMISPWSTNPQTTLDGSGAPKKYVFRAAFVDAFQGQVVARFALDFLQADRGAVLFDADSDYNRGIAEFFRQSYEAAGGSVVAYESYSAGETDFTEQLTRIREANPDVIFLPNYYTEVPLQIHQAHELGIQAPFIGSDAWGTPELISLCGAECEGYYFSTHFSPDAANPTATKFIKAYQDAYDTAPDDVAALTYDSFGLLFQALKAAGKPNRQSLADALHKIERYEGVTGSLIFKGGTGDPIKSAVILQIRGGKFAWIANINP